MINDAHCHFFSRRFFETLARQRPDAASQPDPVARVMEMLGWEPPGAPEELADRWVRELDRHGVRRAALIASIPGDESSVAAAVMRHPARLVGMFMLDPTAPDAEDRVRRALTEYRLRGVCLFPAMHRYAIHDACVGKVFDIAASYPGTVVFVHCGVLSVGVRKKLGLPSRFAVRFGNPLDLHSVALDHPSVPVIIPHFGAGLFREALMAADLCSNIRFDTSSSNAWTKYIPGLTLADVFRQALDVAGPDRLLFGSDSSNFPRGWQQNVRDAQQKILGELGVDASVTQRIFGENFDRLFAA